VDFGVDAVGHLDIRSRAGQTQLVLTPGVARFIPDALAIAKTAGDERERGPSKGDKSAAQGGYIKIAPRSPAAD
jgi:hypothetical protein